MHSPVRIYRQPILRAAGFRRRARARRGFIPVLAQESEFHPGPDYFSRAIHPRGEHSLGFSLSDLHLAFEGLAEGDRNLLQARYGIFVADRPTEGAGRIRVVQAGVPGFLQSRHQGRGVPEIYRLEQVWRGELLTAYAYEFAGCFDFVSHRGQLAIAPSQGDPVHRAVENFLRVVSAHWFLRRGGLLIHASGVVREGRAHLFFGPSSSGKTTVTLLSDGDLILGDDLILLRESDSGFAACAVPFRGLYREPPQTDQAFPLAGLYRLVKDRDDFLVDLSPSLGAAELMGSLPFVMEAGRGGEALETASRIVREMPVRRLIFRKSADFW